MMNSFKFGNIYLRKWYCRILKHCHAFSKSLCSYKVWSYKKNNLPVVSQMLWWRKESEFSVQCHWSRKCKWFGHPAKEMEKQKKVKACEIEIEFITPVVLIWHYLISNVMRKAIGSGPVVFSFRFQAVKIEPFTRRDFFNLKLNSYSNSQIMSNEKNLRNIKN